MTLSIRDTLHFGKFKGMNVGKMLLEDPSWACWIREEKKKADPRDLTFDVETNDMIDVAIERSRSLKKKYASWKLGEKATGEALIKDKAERAAKDVPVTPDSKMRGSELTHVIVDELSADGRRCIPKILTGAKVWPATIASDFGEAIKGSKSPIALNGFKPSEATTKESKKLVYGEEWGAW